MKFGAVFPQTEIGNDPIAIRDYAQAVEALGYDHLVIYDHVLGASRKNRPNWGERYSEADAFHEIFVLLGYLAALTQRLELVTAVLVLPQRQAALAAKQAAQVDVLSGGRLRLGVGVGWNDVEFEALGENFHNRGARVDEQIEVLRALWTQPVVTFHGKWHHISEAGILPMPVQQPIPIWFGGHAEPMLKRVGRLGDGWFPLRAPEAEARGMIERLHGYAREAGRDPANIGIEFHINLSDGAEADWLKRDAGWQNMGATHLSINTMRVGLATPQAHIDALRRMKDLLGVGSG
jgi:probable F420-dependent oxidoreductase